MKTKEVDTVSTIDKSDKAMATIERQMETLSIKQLKELTTKANDLIDKKNDQSLAELRAKFAEMAEQSGHSYDEVVGKNKRGQKKGSSVSKSPIRYRDPENSENTWTGNGRMPNWLVQKKQANVDIEKYRVQ